VHFLEWGYMHVADLADIGNSRLHVYLLILTNSVCNFALPVHLLTPVFVALQAIACCKTSRIRDIRSLTEISFNDKRSPTSNRAR
jgi:hypothetical protein